MYPNPRKDNIYFNAPSIRPIIGKKGVRAFELADDWIVLLDDHRWLNIPAGTLTNYGTVPWYFRWIISPTDPVIAIPSIIHDYLIAELIPKDHRDMDIHVPKVHRVIYTISGNYIEHSDLYSTKYDWIESARYFRKYAHSFEGRTARIKAEVCYYFIRLRGILRGL